MLPINYHGQVNGISIVNKNGDSHLFLLKLNDFFFFFALLQHRSYAYSNLEAYFSLLKMLYIKEILL